MNFSKKIDFDLKDKELSKAEKKEIAAARKRIIELRDDYPVKIKVRFKPPFWATKVKA